MEIELGITILLLVALAFLATVDMAFGRLSDVGLRRLMTDAEETPAHQSTTFLTEILDNRPRFRFTLTAALQFLLIAVAVLITSLSLRLFPSAPFMVIAFFIGAALALVFRQVIPYFLSYRNPEKTLLALLPLLRPFYSLFSFVAIPWHKSSERLRRNDQPPAANGGDATDESDEDDIQALIDVGEEEGILEEEEGELIHSILEFSDTQVNEVMTPRTDIIALPLTSTVREARDRIIESKYSRLPVYREQIDNVEGVVYVRDLLQYWTNGREDEPIKSLLRPAFCVPETKAVAQLLEEMQKTHIQLALVIDEYGGLAGLVTVEDILEEIVGEIEDEDTATDEVVQIIEASDGYYDVLGSTEVGKIERLFDLEIEDDDFTTIAGLVISESGYVPRAGAQLTFRGLDVEVLEADERRIARLRLRRAVDGDTAQPEE